MTALRIANPVLETGSREALLALQGRRLLAQVRRAASRIPFYRDRWPAAARDLTSLAAFQDTIPFTSKPDFLGGDDPTTGARFATPGSRPYALHLTSGTTGLGQEVHALTRYDQEASASTWVYQARWAGLEPGDSVFYTFPVGLQTGGLWSSHASDRMASLGFHMGPYSTDKKVEYMLRFRPHGLIASPAYLTQLQANLSDRGLHPRDALPNLKALFIAGESYTIDWATRAGEYWGATISEWYGSMQGGLNQCFSCERGVAPGGQRGTLHCMEHRILCEVLDPDTNCPVEPGEEGEMVITSLYREGFPVIRFRTGDRVRWLGATCPCGRPFASIEAGTIARYDDMMKIRGQNLWPEAVDRIVFADGDVEEYAGSVSVDERGRETVTLAIEWRPALAPPAEEQADRVRALADAIKEKLNVRMDVTVAPYRTLPRFEFKVRRWTDTRRQGRAFVRYVKE
jgi:phenylacetate-CoA ligase